MNRSIRQLWVRPVLSGFVLVSALSLLPPTVTGAVQGLTSDEGTPDPSPAVPDPGMNLLVPDGLGSPDSCGVPKRGPFGQDVEVFVGPWDSVGNAYRVSQDPGWYPQEALPLLSWAGYPEWAFPGSGIAAVARGVEEIVAVWQEGSPAGELVWSTWSASGRAEHSGPPGSVSPGGWYYPVTDRANYPHKLDRDPDGDPALLSRDPLHWTVFARQGGTIWFREWANGALGEWDDLDNVGNAASDPAVTSKDPHHMAVFYRDDVGRAWFTEWNGGIWRSQPVLLSPSMVFLPLVTRGSSGASFAVGAASSSKSHAPDLGTTSSFTFASELSVASRNAGHVAVLGVDAGNQLWVKEWTHRNESDWSDTRWVKLMGNVAIERPAVASRHSNHLGVAVRDTSGKPWYIEWTYRSGWRAPVSLGETRTAPLTFAATAIDAMSVFSVDGNRIWHKDWRKDAGWGGWQELAGTDVADGQTLTAVVRRMDDVMLLGRVGWGAGTYKHYSLQDRDLTQSPIAPSVTVQGYPRGQVLAWVDGEMLWVAANQGEVGNWKADALALSDGITDSLALAAHPWAGWENRVALAAADLDFDGDDEVVVATLATTATVSVLDFAVSPTLVITSPSTFTPISFPGQAIDLNVAVGDLDGDGRQDEVVIAYRAPGDPYSADILAYEYVTSTHTLDYKGSASVDVLRHDLEIAIGKLQDWHPTCGRLLGEQLVVGSTVSASGGEGYRAEGRVETYCVTISPTLSISRADSYSHTYLWLPAPDPDDQVHGYSAALATGDIDADGLEEIAYSFWNAVETIGYDSHGNREVSMEWVWPLPQPDWERSLAVGDVDRDGKVEITASCLQAGTGNHTRIVEVMDEGRLKVSSTAGSDDPYGTVLAGDMDNDSFRSDLVGCTTVSEVWVIAVVNGPPRWYAGGVPVQSALVGYATSQGTSEEKSYGTTTNVGGALSVGIEAEVNVPFIGTKIGEVRFSVTQDFLSTTGQSSARETSVTESGGYDDDAADSLGIVVFNWTNYACFYYDVYSPEAPAEKSVAMACRPTGGTHEDFLPLKDWHSPSFRAGAGGSWVDVGHHSSAGVVTNEVTTYPSSLPIDPYMLKYTWDPNDPRYISRASSGAYTWSIAFMQGASQANSQDFETNTTISSGATVGVVTVDASVTLGFGWQKSRAVSWTEDLEIYGAVGKIPPEGHDCYAIVPYVYHAKATTQAGATYPYLELDYYVPYREACPWLPGADDGMSPADARLLLQ